MFINARLINAFLTCRIIRARGYYSTFRDIFYRCKSPIKCYSPPAVLRSSYFCGCKSLIRELNKIIFRESYLSVSPRSRVPPPFPQSRFDRNNYARRLRALMEKCHNAMHLQIVLMLFKMARLACYALINARLIFYVIRRDIVKTLNVKYIHTHAIALNWRLRACSRRIVTACHDALIFALSRIRMTHAWRQYDVHLRIYNVRESILSTPWISFSESRKSGTSDPYATRFDNSDKFLTFSINFEATFNRT